MSMRVLNPAVLTEFCKMRASSPAGMRCGVNRIKKDLFGPVNPTETNKVFTEQMEKHQDKAVKKWGFDFRTGTPLNVNSQFIWERVSIQEFVYAPEVYTLTRGGHMRATQEQGQQRQKYGNVTDTLNALMDERAARENAVYRVRTISSSSTGSESCEELLLDEVPMEPITPIVRSADLFNMPASVCVGSAGVGRQTRACTSGQQRKRQPKITEYMKERKRLAQPPKKMLPNKRMRLSGGSADGVAHAPPRHSIVSHFPLKKSNN